MNSQRDDIVLMLCGAHHRAQRDSITTTLSCRGVVCLIAAPMPDHPTQAASDKAAHALERQLALASRLFVVGAEEGLNELERTCLRRAMELGYPIDRWISWEPDPDPNPARRRDLLFELRPGWAEGWVRVELERCNGRIRVVQSGHNYCYYLEPTDFVIGGLVASLERAQQNRGDGAILGEVGTRMLAHLDHHATAKPATRA